MPDFLSTVLQENDPMEVGSKVQLKSYLSWSFFEIVKMGKLDAQTNQTYVYCYLYTG